MPARDQTTRIQTYLTDPKVAAALKREARVSKITLSQAAARAIARGLQKSPPADPEDRLLRLELALRDHMRRTQRDIIIAHELIIESVRALLLRLPDAPADHDPLIQAAVNIQIDRLLCAIAGRIESGLSTAQAPQRCPSSDSLTAVLPTRDGQELNGESRSFLPAR